MIKRVFDIFFSVLGIVFFLPVFLVISLLISLESKGPILFLQDRVGLNEKFFKIIKFRTMKVDHNSKSTITLIDDNRITRIGSLIRRYKIDELPELFNVLKGDMSFVGPRPDVPGYADKLQGEDRNILKLRPGITSMASLKYANEELLLSKVEDPVDYNNNVIYPDKVKMNLNYYYNHNIWIDIKVIFATIFLLKKSIFIKNN
jgi:lipopolysaccharide/colanic/teichoic acid biosynthesis glycosyltransferase